MAVEHRETAKAIIVHGDAILLTNYAGEPIWCLPGGGIEARESPEQALRRELREEIGLPLAWCAPVIELDASYSPFGRPHDTVKEHMHLYCGQLFNMGPEKIARHERNLNKRWFSLASVMPGQSPQWQVVPQNVLSYIVKIGGQMMQGRRGR